MSLLTCQPGKVRNAVLPTMDLKTLWNATLELLEQAYRVQEVPRKLLKTQNAMITCHSSHHGMNVSSTSTSWRF